GRLFVALREFCLRLGRSSRVRDGRALRSDRYGGRMNQLQLALGGCRRAGRVKADWMVAGRSSTGQATLARINHRRDEVSPSILGEIGVLLPPVVPARSVFI